MCSFFCLIYEDNYLILWVLTYFLFLYFFVKFSDVQIWSDFNGKTTFIKQKKKLALETTILFHSVSIHFHMYSAVSYNV